jgi:FlaG/FlaF family flagellin (archaellin)
VEHKTAPVDDYDRMRGRSLAGGDRAVSKEGMAAIAFALTVGMIAVTGGLLMQTGGSLSAGGPILSASAEPIDAANDQSGQWLYITHDSGDAVDVANLSINVTAPDHRKRATVHGLPTAELRQDDYTGNHLFTIGSAGIDGEATTEDSDGIWVSGETLGLRIEPGRTDLESGERVRVTIYHVGERRQLYSETVPVG